MANKEQKRAQGPMHGPRVHEKPKNFKAAMGNLLRSMNGNTAWIICALVFTIASTALSIISPNILKDLTNTITAAVPIFANGIWFNAGAQMDMGAIEKYAIILSIIIILNVVFSYLQGLIMAHVTQRISRQMRSDISKKINRLPFSYIDHTTNGDILSRITNDVDTITQSLNNSVTTLVSSIIMLIGTTVMMFITNYVMALCAIISAFIGFALVALVMGKSQKFFMAQQRNLGAINGQIEESFSGHDVLMVSNALGEDKAKFDTLNANLYRSGWKAQFLGGLMGPIMNFIGNLGYVAVCVAGALLTANGTITFGVIVAFMLYVRLFTNPLTQLAQVGSSLQSAGAAGERVYEFLNAPELEDEADKITSLPNVEGNVEFVNVRFGYEKDKEIIHDFSASVRAGQKVAIVGPTGAGKTTMVNLLMKFYNINSGKILIDGVDTHDLSREYIHSLFGMVLQDTWLFEGTIIDNIIYNQQGVTKEMVEAACKACGLHHFIMTLPEGYNTVLDDNTSISAGQKQLLTIARAMVQNAPMLILDEATSSVDTRTEVLISKAMDALMADRTSFVIAHRLSTIKNADLILVMENGDIVESGTHAELLSRGGTYAKLYNSQFETVE